jgi:hypothetical protein
MAIMAAAGSVASAQIGSAFTYQGVLRAAGTPVDGLVDIQFRLYDAASGGTQIGSTLQADAALLVSGLVNVDLDFGPNAFDGSARFIEISVRSTGEPGFTALNPRVAIKPAPYALFAANSQPGPTGPAGPTGAAGPVGPVGPAGATGAQGPQGPQGDTGPVGPAGATGAQGPQGDTGPAGANGNDGAPGPQGPQGDTGPAGAPGAQGPQGDTGPAGANGNDGAPGPQGPAGPTGATGPSIFTVSGNDAWTNTSARMSIGTGVAPSGTKLAVRASDSNDFSAASLISSRPGASTALYCEANSGQATGIYSVVNTTVDGSVGVFGFAQTSFGRVYGVSGQSLSNTEGSAGVLGTSGGAFGNTYGVLGTTGKATAIGVCGQHTDSFLTSGTLIGVQGESTSNPNPSTTTIGVRGLGNTQGVQGSGGQIGVYGITTGTSPTSYGVLGKNLNTTATTGTVIGVQGDGVAPVMTTGSIIGVNGAVLASASTMTTGFARGVSGSSNIANANSAGVFGVNTAQTGGSIGVLGVIEAGGSSGGFGVRGENRNTLGGVGVYGSTASASGRGVMSFGSVYINNGGAPTANGDAMSIDVRGGRRARLDADGVWQAYGFNNISDRNKKENFTAVSPSEVLEKVAALPITTWSYKGDQNVTHMGPMAQDFRAAFGLGQNDTTIGTVDADGVALAAIQGLNQVVQDQQKQIDALKSELDKARQPALPIGAGLGTGLGLGLALTLMPMALRRLRAQKGAR